MIYLILLILLIITIAIIELNHLKLKRKSNELIKELKKKIYLLEYFHKENSVDFIEIVNYFNSLDTEEPTIFKLSVKKVAITLVVSFMFLFFIFKVLTPYEKSDLYEKNYKPLLDTSFTYRGSVDSKNIEFHNAVDLYLSGNYDKAEELFNTQTTVTPELLLYSGLNKMAKNKFYCAIKLFNRLYTSDEYTIETQWYLALCYIKINQKEKAKDIMKVLSKTEGIYKKKAEIILKNL